MIGVIDIVVVFSIGILITFCDMVGTIYGSFKDMLWFSKVKLFSTYIVLFNITPSVALVVTNVWLLGSMMAVITISYYVVFEKDWLLFKDNELLEIVVFSLIKVLLFWV